MQRGQRLASTPNCVKPVIVLALEAFLADCHEEDGEANKLDDTFHNTQPTRSVSFCLRAMTPHLAVLSTCTICSQNTSNRWLKCDKSTIAPPAQTFPLQHNFSSRMPPF
ncbi:hypothetical protein BDW71DRAFT_147958 [Aspergillus fruticulosus]